MAKKISNLAEVKVYINGKEQAKKDLEELRKVAASYANQIKLANNQMMANSDDPTKFKEFNEAKKNLKVYQREYKQIQKTIKETEKLEVDLATAMSRLSEQNVTQLRNLQRQLEAIRNRVDPKDDTDGNFLSYLNDSIKKVVDTIKNRKGELTEFKDILGSLGDATPKQLSDVHKRLEQLIAGTTEGTKEMKAYKRELNNVVKEEQRRLQIQAQDVQQKVKEKKWKGTIEETQQAIELQKQYQKTLKATDAKALEDVERTINGLNQKLDSYNKKKASGVMKNLDDHSYSEIEQAIVYTKQLQEAQKPGTSSWNRYAKQVADATLYLERWNDQNKRTKMIELSKTDLGKMNDEDLKNSLRYWDGLVNGIGRTNVAMKQYKAIYEKMQTETTRRSEKIMTSIEGGDMGANINQMQYRLKYLQDFRATIDSTKPDAYVRVDAAIKKIKDSIKETESGFMSFDDAIAKAGAISSNSFNGTLEDLEKIQKALKEGINTKLNLSDKNDVDRMKQAQALLEDTVKKQIEMNRLRAEGEAKQAINDVKAGNFDRTIEETQQAIKYLEEYKKTLRTQSDAPVITTVNETITKLNEQLGKGKKELIDYHKALDIADKVADKTFDGTSEDIEKAKQSLIEYKKTLKQRTDATEIKKVDDAFRKLGKTSEAVANKIVDVDDVIKRLDSASLEELQQAAKQLQEQLQNTARNSDPNSDYARTAAKLRDVSREMKSVKKEWEGQENVITRTTKRLMAYVAVYGGFNEILGRMREVFNLNLQLSDSMADVQKTTGLMGVELQELGRELERIDTRTATTELYNLAAAAGQIGLKTQEDVLGFAKAANTISVALNELGAEGSATLTKIATLTNDVTRYGTEDALMRVGSAINELTANSAATAGPIADFISRVGGIASASGIAIHEMAALGAATDASAQSIEIAGTSMNKFISALVSNTENIAYATNLNARELQNLINEGNTMQAVVRVLESMQNMDRGVLSGAMKELGSEGARMNQYIASLVSNLDMLKAQLAISREAFDENVSVINEYNVKQESAMGILQRMKNAFLDTFVNSKMTVILKDILEKIASIPDWLEKHRLILFGIRVIIAQIIAFKIPFLLNALAKQLSGMYALLAGPMRAAMVSFNNAWVNAAIAVSNAGKSINGFTGKIRILWRLMASNPIGIIVSALSVAAVAFYHFREETDEVAKATAELTKKHTRQIEELQALRTALEATNTSYAVKAAAMREINSLYSKYLGFELNELDTYEKKKAALDYINAKLKENQTLEMADRQKQVYNETFGKDSQADLEGLTKGLMDVSGIGAKRLTEAMDVVHKSIQEGARTTDEVITALEEHFKMAIDIDDSEEYPFGLHMMKEARLILDWFTDTALEDLEDYIEKYATLQEQLAGTDEYFSQQKVENQMLSNKALEELAVAHQTKIEAIKTAHEQKIAELEKEGAKMTEAEQVAHLKALLTEQEQYLKTAEKMLQKAKKDDETFLAGQTNSKGYIDLGNMHAKYGGTDRGHIVSSRVNELNAIRDNMKKIRDEQEKNDRLLEEAYTKLELAQEKEANDEEIALMNNLVEEKKKIRNDLNKDLAVAEIEWTNKYAELQTWATSDARQKWNKTTEEISQNIRSLQIQIAGDPWGKAFDLKDWKQFPVLIENLETASITSLVQGFEKLRDNTKLITKDVDAFNKMFDLKTPLKDLDEVNTQVFRWLGQIRAELKRRDRNTSGAPIFTNAKEELDNVMNNLQTHFLKRQATIRQAFIEGSLTSEEMDRRISENDQVFVNERIQLRKLLLGENSNFMKEMYPDLADTDFSKLRLDLEAAEDDIADNLRKSLEEDENIVREGMIEIRKAIEKELLASDPFETLRQSFRSSLDELMLMSSEFERDMVKNLQFSNTGDIKYDPFNIMGLDESEQQQRLDFLIELSEKSYTVDKDGLRKMFMSHEDYYNWVMNLDDKQMQLMLTKLQWFYDESLLKHKAYADRLEKSLDSRYEQEGLNLDNVSRLEWDIEELEKVRENLKSAQTKAIDNAQSESALKQAYKLNEEEIDSINQLINRKEEELFDAREKAANKARSQRAKHERETKERMEASISDLKAFYNEMEAVIRKQSVEFGWTPEDTERKLQENKNAAQRDEIELRKYLLGDSSSFDPNAHNGYTGAITGTEFFGTKKGEKELKKQAAEIQVWGKALIGGMRNEIAKGEVEIATDLQKVRSKIKDALLEGDMFGKFENEFATMLDELGLLTSDFEDAVNKALTDSNKEKGEHLFFGLSEDEQAKRIAELTQFADQSYKINEAGLKELMMKNTQFSDWVQWMSDDEMSILLTKLRDYYDRRIELTRQYQDRLNKEFESYYQQTGQQAVYEKDKQDIDKSKTEREQLEGFGINRGIDYDGKRMDIAREYQNESEVLNDKAQFLNERLNTLKEGSAEYIATQKLIVDTELAQNQLLADSQKELTQVYMDEWTKRAERWGQWGEMFGEYLGEQMMLEKQANDARAKGDLETAKKIEQQQKQNKQALIQNLLSKIVDEAALWAKEYALKMMFNSLMMAEDKRRAIEEVSLEGKKSTLSIFLSALTGQSKEHSKGIPGLVTGAIIFAATMALQALAKSAISNMFPEAAGVSTSNRKLSTGMLTYAEGNYPVLGNDGKVYDAKYEGAGLKTGIYGGGAHFGIFSEKQPEMIVDGKTTQKLILNYPYIYDAITTIAKNGRLVNAMPTFATGDYPAGMRRIAQVEAVDITNGNEQMLAIQEELAMSREVNRQLLAVLNAGISARVDGLENYKQQKKNEQFLKRRGID